MPLLQLGHELLLLEAARQRDRVRRLRQIENAGSRSTGLDTIRRKRRRCSPMNSRRSADREHQAVGGLGATELVQVGLELFSLTAQIYGLAKKSALDRK